MVRNRLIQSHAQGQLVFPAVGWLHETRMTWSMRLTEKGPWWLCMLDTPGPKGGYLKIHSRPRAYYRGSLSPPWNNITEREREDKKDTSLSHTQNISPYCSIILGCFYRFLLPLSSLDFGCDTWSSWGLDHDAGARTRGRYGRWDAWKAGLKGPPGAAGTTSTVGIRD